MIIFDMDHTFCCLIHSRGIKTQIWGNIHLRKTVLNLPKDCYGHVPLCSMFWCWRAKKEWSLWSSIGSSGRVGGGGAQETWNLCGRLWWLSFLWLNCTGLGGAMAPSAPPPGSATVVSLLCQRRTFSGLNLFSPVSLTLLARQSTKFFWWRYNLSNYDAKNRYFVKSIKRCMNVVGQKLKQ